MLGSAFYNRVVCMQSGQLTRLDSKGSKSNIGKFTEELFREFQGTVRNIPKPFFMRAHKWDTAFPAVAVARDDMCLRDNSKKLTINGDFCVSPSVEGAILSGMGAAVAYITFWGYGLDW